MSLNPAIAEFLRSLAPIDLESERLYVVHQSALGREAMAWGWTSPAADLLVKDAIGDAWAGRGACLIVNDMLTRDRFDGRDMMLAAAVHEMVHILQHEGGLYDFLGDADSAEIAIVALKVADALTVEKPPVAENHGPDFIRLALHLIHRAAAHGERLYSRMVASTLVAWAGRPLATSRQRADSH